MKLVVFHRKTTSFIKKIKFVDQKIDMTVPAKFTYDEKVRTIKVILLLILIL